MTLWIRCKRCGLRSHNPNDVTHRYCGNCHAFHVEPTDYELGERLTEREYTARWNRPTQDDLARANCERAGTLGHRWCGICDQHHKPRFLCGCVLILRPL